MQFDPSRRLFLRNAGLAAVAPIVIPPAVGPIEKIVKYFFAPKGGWNSAVSLTGESVYSGFLTPTMITRECLRILQKNLVFIASMDERYGNLFAANVKVGSSVKVRIPTRFIN